MNSIPIPQPKKSDSGKLLGIFYPLTRDELLAWKENGMFKGAAYLGLCLRCDNPFFDKAIKVNVEKFCERWRIGVSQYFKSLRRLKEIGFLTICRTESFIYLNSIDSASNYPNGESTVQMDSPTVQMDNLQPPGTLLDSVPIDCTPQTLEDNLTEVINTFSDSNASKSEIPDIWIEAEIVEDEDFTNTQEIKESFVDQQNYSSGSNVPQSPEVEKFSLSTEINNAEPEQYTSSTQIAIASFEQTGVIPKGIDLIQWSVEAIGGDVILYRKSGRILSFKPNDIDKKFLKFLELRLTQNKAGKTANPMAWVNAMERNPSRWGELTDLVGAWQREEFLETDEGKAAKTAYKEAKNPAMAKYLEWMNDAQ